MFPIAALFSYLEGAATASTNDTISQTIVGIIIVSVFLLLAVEKVHRLLVVVGAVALLWAITYLSPYRLVSFEAAKDALDMNVLFLLAAMMALVGVIKTTGVFEWVVAKILNRAAGDPFRILAVFIWFTGLLAALCDNVTTVIFVTPMAIQVARAIRLNPVALLLPVVIASNVGGTATLIGDPPNIMIGSGAGLSFTDFLENLTPPSLVMLCLLPWLSARYFAKDLNAAREIIAHSALEIPRIRDRPLLIWSLGISALVFVGFLTHGVTGMPTSVPATIGAGALLVVQDILYMRTHKPTYEERRHGLLEVIENEIEWPTLAFFGFLFIAVGAAVNTGLIDTLARGLSAGIQSGSSSLSLNTAGTLLFAAFLILWVSGLVSGIIDNIPFVAVMIPIIHRIAPGFSGDTTVLWWALALGACLGGNGTMIGASANLTVAGIGERFGIRISFREFTAFGSRITAITLAISSFYLATYVYLGALTSAILWSIAFIILVGALRLARSSTRSAGIAR